MVFETFCDVFTHEVDYRDMLKFWTMCKWLIIPPAWLSFVATCSTSNTKRAMVATWLHIIIAWKVQKGGSIITRVCWTHLTASLQCNKRRHVSLFLSWTIHRDTGVVWSSANTYQVWVAHCHQSGWSLDRFFRPIFFTSMEELSLLILTQQIVSFS